MPIGGLISADYLTTWHPTILLAATLEQIISQKWISNMINGYEGWELSNAKNRFSVLKNNNQLVK